MKATITIYHGDGNTTNIHTEDIKRVGYARDRNGTPIGFGGWMSSGGGFVSPWFEHSPSNLEAVQDEIKNSVVLYDGPEMGAHAVYWERPSVDLQRDQRIIVDVSGVWCFREAIK